MKRTISNWTIEDIYKKRGQISFPDFQREPKLWNNKDKQLLIDSILRDIDIPKLYFHETENNTYEVIDGQQRLWAIWGFIDDEFKYESEDKQSPWSKLNGKKFNEFPKELRDKIRYYELQIAIIKDVTDEYLRKLFLRLQLGLLLVAGEKLNASTGLIRDFVFKKMVHHPFIQAVKIPSRRHSKETLCAQICVNSFSRKNIGAFARTRYEDLHSFFEDYKIVDGNERIFFDERCAHIKTVLDILNSNFKDRAEELKNRSFILSTYLFVEELIENEQNVAVIMPEFVKFIIKLLRRLRDEAKAGFERKNKELYIFESYLSNAPGEKYQIENRHKKLKEFLKYFHEQGEIMGD